ncbi:hypothetical protein FB45DRAFT_417607 [Roridomyces roridus]|uniref:Uncharacterized protein n=1 Tax=Roridomyces roridus TaxID=1738132 RepID=A0AAD7FV58_9AGAR|nr:hypothetical protein FB45DRAFT_417607 [Roridomyces roridus]
MDPIPTLREVELETLLRQRDNQLTELTASARSHSDVYTNPYPQDEVTRLRTFLVSQPSPAATDAVTIPPALTSLLLPHLSAPSKPSSSTSTTAALTQRTRLLQEENDELYELLRQSETGKLKEEVRGLRRLVERLDNALRESHQVVLNLSTELDKSYEVVLSNAPRAEKQPSRSPRNSYHPLPSNGTTTSNGGGAPAGKVPPTGPRAHKKPRLTGPEPQASPPPPPTGPKNQRQRESSPRPPKAGSSTSTNSNGRMDVDEHSPPVERDQDSGRHRDRSERRDDRERDRDAGRRERRNGNGNGGGGRSGGSGPRRGGAAERGPPTNVDRTLKERMGL